MPPRSIATFTSLPTAASSCIASGTNSAISLPSTSTKMSPASILSDAGDSGITCSTTSSPVWFGYAARTRASVSRMRPSRRSSAKGLCSNSVSSVPRGTGWLLWILVSATCTRSSGRKKLDAACVLAPALRATTRPSMSTTGEPDDPPDVPDAACR